MISPYAIAAPVRLGCGGLLLGLAACAGTSESQPETQPVASRSRCSTMECFREREIRDVQLLDNDTLVIFIGPERCAFRMELEGPYCGAAGFTIDFELDQRSALLGGQQPLICIYDRPYIRDAFERSPEGVMPGGRGPQPSTADAFDRCRVTEIIALSDDELLETYVETGAQPPLPPVGSGEISVENEEESAEQEAQPESSNGTAAAPAPTPAGTADGDNSERS